MPLPDDVQAEIVAVYRAGDRIAAICARFGISTTVLYPLLRAHGVTPGRRTNARLQEWSQPELDRIAALHHGGAGFDVLKAEMGAGEARIRRALDVLGLAGGPDRVVYADGTAAIRVTADDPLRVMASPRGLVPEARLVAARTLGRPLQPDERVFHRNGDRTDCRPENLAVKR